VRLFGHGTDTSGEALEKLQSTRIRSDVAVRPIMIDQTRLVVSGCLLESMDAGTIASGQFKWCVWSCGQQRESVATGRLGVSDQF
jgi:hypothetical protein